MCSLISQSNHQSHTARYMQLLSDLKSFGTVSGFNGGISVHKTPCVGIAPEESDSGTLAWSQGHTARSAWERSHGAFPLEAASSRSWTGISNHETVPRWKCAPSRSTGGYYLSSPSDAVPRAKRTPSLDREGLLSVFKQMDIYLV